ncbi:MAG: AAA family ATPase [Alkaliphilus sp.]
MRVYLVLGNEELEKKIGESKVFEVVDKTSNLDTFEEILEYIDTTVGAIIINRLLDEQEGEKIYEICKKVLQKNIKIVVLNDDLSEHAERILTTKLVNIGVMAHLKIENLLVEQIEDILKKYPKDFDFSSFESVSSRKTKIKYVEKIETKSVFKEAIAVWSPLSSGSSTVAAHLAYTLASRSNCKVCLLDFNPLKPSFKKLFKVDFDFGLLNVLDSLERDILDNDKLLSFITTHKKQKKLDLLSGVYDLNDYYVYASNCMYLKHLDEIIEKLKFIYDYVVIDTHAYHDIQTTNQALKKADKVVVPFFGNRYDIAELNRYTDMFKKYSDFDTTKFNFVVNKYYGSDLTSFEIESALEGNVVGYISNKKEYEKNSSFNTNKIINEYVDILKKIKVGVNLKKKHNLFSKKTGGEVN